MHEWLHPIFVVSIIPIVYFAARRSHFDKKITTILVIGFLFILAGWLLGHFWLGIVFESSVTMMGSTLLIFGHWKNYRHHRMCKNSSHKHHPIEEESKRKRNEAS